MLKLVFDFDGVLIDSRQESLLNAYNTSTNQLCSSLLGLDGSIQQLFELNRPHIRSAGELVCLMDWCLAQSFNQPWQMSLADFNGLLTTWTEIAQKERKFFENRSQLKNLLGDDWYKLQPAFQPLWSFAQQHSSDLLIVTHKNKQAVLDLAQFYELDISARQVFSGDGAADKVSNFLELAKTFPAKQYYFIDDNLRNLIELQKQLADQLPLILFYADWGYGSEDTLAEAKKLGLNPQSQQSFITLYSTSASD